MSRAAVSVSAHWLVRSLAQIVAAYLLCLARQNVNYLAHAVIALDIVVICSIHNSVIF